MESYIVRIYRHAEEQPEGVSGLIEKVGEDQVQSFTSITELFAAFRQVFGSGTLKTLAAPRLICVDGKTASNSLTGNHKSCMERKE